MLTHLFMENTYIYSFHQFCILVPFYLFVGLKVLKVFGHTRTNSFERASYVGVLTFCICRRMCEITAAHLPKFDEKCLCEVLVVKFVDELSVIMDFPACLNGVDISRFMTSRSASVVRRLSSSFVVDDVFEPLVRLCGPISANDSVRR